MVNQRKQDYARRLNYYLDNFSKAITINVNNVGSKKIATERKRLRPRNIHILMGKNTIIRKVLRDRAERLETTKPKQSEAALKIIDMVEGNCGFVFIPENESIAGLRDEIIKEKVQTAAKFGVIAPVDVHIPVGPTGQDPSQTAFFQTMNISTKINRGQVEITAPITIIFKGDKVGRSAAELLVMLNIKPFHYGINVEYVFDKGDVYPADVLSITADDVAVSFGKAVREVAALCLALNYPTAASVPHSIMSAYKNMLAVGLGCKTYTWENLDKVKEILKDPSKFASAGPAAATGDAQATQAAAPEDEPEPESSEAAGGIFGASSSSEEEEDSDSS